jgi:hypothetical protein
MEIFAVDRLTVAQKFEFLADLTVMPRPNFTPGEFGWGN